MSIPRTVLADFRIHTPPSPENACMICFETHSQMFSHMIETAQQVHHFACLKCLKSWAQACERDKMQPWCPLCRLVFSERALVKICSIFSRQFIKERGDLWQQQYLQLVREMITQSGDQLELSSWNAQGEKLKEELHYFLLTLRYNFIQNLTNPEAVKHFIKSLDNFYDSILMMKSLNIISLMMALSVFLPEPMDATGVVSERMMLLQNFIDHLGEKVLIAKQEMTKDYKEFIAYDMCSKKFSLISCSVTLCSLWGLMSYFNEPRQPDPATPPFPYYQIAKISFTVFASVLAYVKVRKETENLAQSELSNRVKRLALD